MNTAAVGFQCPECVRAGAHDVRSPQAAYGGKRSGNPGLTSIALIVVNVAIWLGVLLTGGDHSVLVRRLALWREDVLINFPGSGVHQVYGVSDGAWWELITSGFMHVEPTHLLFNMVALFFIGPMVESVIGRARFLAIYFGSLLTASALVLWTAPVNAYTLGASGAIFGLLGASLILAIKGRGDVRSIAMWLGLNVIITFTMAGISWEGHLGGLLGGAGMAAVLAYAPTGDPRSRQRLLWQVAGCLLVVAIAVAAIVVRVDQLTPV